MAAQQTSAGQAPAARRLAQRTRDRLRRTPLRLKLIAALLALVAVALAVISTASAVVLRDYLNVRADRQARQVYREWVAALHASVVRPGILHFGPYVVAVRAQGEQLQPSAAGDPSSLGPVALPDVPESIDWVRAHAGQLVTVSGLNNGDNWRIITSPISYTTLFGTTQAGALIVGIDLGDVSGTIGRLTTIEVVVGVIVLAGLAIVGIAIVRASLRPLTDIERTAHSIAAGDLTSRVPDDDPGTEVGRLGRSLNAMLAQIEQAFAARSRSEEAARRSEERMRQFVADASHELRTPLTVIRGFAEHFRQRGGLGTAAPGGAAGSAPAPAAAGLGDEKPAAGNGAAAGQNGPLTQADLDRLIRRVEDEAARMGMLVDDLLLLARLDQQRPLERHTVDLLALAADAAHDARLVAPERAVAVTVSSGAALLVLGDEVRLRQVIGNLMNNALTHTPAGSPIELRLRSGILGYGQPAAVLEVADQGPGLTPEQASRAFERFYRADQARTAAGTGLGLSIVAALVAAHGGQVWVESPPGGGAVFAIALPLAPEAVDASRETADSGEEDPEQADPELAPGAQADSDQARPEQARHAEQRPPDQPRHAEPGQPDAADAARPR